MKNEIHMVTGAFGYTGKYIAKILLNKGVQVRTLTNSINRKNFFGNKVKPYLYNFNDPYKLEKSLTGCSVLYNTYWVRFNHKKFNHNEAVENTIALFKAAQAAGVKRVVHISITNPNKYSHLEYFRGKAILEEELQKMFDSFAIVRPAVIFGPEDILINNIAWLIRTFPVFGYFGNGRYKLQPIYVEDLAALAIESAFNTENIIVDAIGNETYTYKELAITIAKMLQKKRIIIPIPPYIGYIIGLILGKLKGDVMITKEEIDGLMQNLLYTTSMPIGKIKLSQWLQNNKNNIGTKYNNEIQRRIDRSKEYSDL